MTLVRGGAPAVSIVVPVYRERAMVPALLATLEPFAGLHEVVIADGGSDDGTFEALSAARVGRVIRAEKGRARQMNAGAREARGHVLLFLHADTEIPPEGPERALVEVDRGADGGCFGVRIKSRHRRLRVAGALQTLRSRVMVSATGDHALFARRSVFFELGGFDERLPICEDLDFVSRFAAARGRHRWVCLRDRVSTSGRRWERNGINRTIALMWALRLAYHLGTPPATLARYYRDAR